MTATIGVGISIPQALWQRAECHPEATALVYATDRGDDTWLTRAEICGRAAECAARLAGHGVVPGDVVLIAVDHGVPQVLLFLGTLFAGAIPCLYPAFAPKLDPGGYDHRLDGIVDRLRPQAIVSDRATLPTRAGVSVIDASAICSEQRSAAPDQPRGNFGDTAFLQLSSGSTGSQKVIPVTHAAVLGRLSARRRALAIGESDVMVGWAPLYHDLGLIANLLAPLVEGTKTVLMSPLEWLARPALLMRVVHRHAGTICFMPNFAFNYCVQKIRDAELEGVRLDRWRVLANGSEPVRADSFTAFAKRFAQWGFNPRAFASGYGLAEHTLTATVTRLGERPRVDHVDRRLLQEERRAQPTPASADTIEIVSCGACLEDVEIQIRDRTGESLADRNVGEIFIRSPFVFKGYLNDPQRTAETLVEGWLATGDLGYLAEDELYVCGRLKDLIIVGGANVSAEDVEAAVRNARGIRPGRVVAFGVPDDQTGTEKIVLVAELDAPDEPNPTDVESELRRSVRREVGVSLGHVEFVPPHFIAKTTSGKIARSATRERWLARAVVALTPMTVQ